MNKEFHVTVDFNDDIAFTVFTGNNLNQMMEYFRQIGIKRVYWIYFGGAKEDLFWRDNGAAKWFNRDEKMKILGDPLTMAVKSAHKHELEIYGYIKPYDWGLSWTYPEGSPLAEKYGTLQRIGGRMPRVTRFLREHPNMRIKRNMTGIPHDLSSRTIKKIKLIKSNDKPTRIKNDNIQIWVSNDNFKYQRYLKKFGFSNRVEQNPNNTSGHVRVLTLDDLEISEKYIVVTTNLRKGEPDFMNTAKSLAKVYSDDSQQLPISVATGYAVWSHLHGLNEAWRTRDFRKEGLEFDQGRGSHNLVLDIDNSPRTNRIQGKGSLDKSGFIGIAKGKNVYLPGTPCEIYPEVREFWLRLVKECIEKGVDGIDFSHRSHGAATDDRDEYGFNELIVEEYKSLYGKDILAGSLDEEKLAELRGSYYTAFLREAKKEISDHGIRMQIHVNLRNLDYSQRKFRSAHLRHMKLDWETWIEEDIADEVTLRAWRASELVSKSSATNKVLNLIKKKQKRVFFNQYVNWNAFSKFGEPLSKEIETVFRDGRIDGFILYESASFTRVIDKKFIGSDDIKEVLKCYVK